MASSSSGPQPVGLALVAGEVDRAVQRVLQVELAGDHVVPQRGVGVLEVGQPHLGARVERVDRHLLVGRPGDLDPPVDQAGRRRRHPPGACPPGSPRSRAGSRAWRRPTAPAAGAARAASSSRRRWPSSRCSAATRSSASRGEDLVVAVAGRAGDLHALDRCAPPGRRCRPLVYRVTRHRSAPLLALASHGQRDTGWPGRQWRARRRRDRPRRQQARSAARAGGIGRVTSAARGQACYSGEPGRRPWHHRDRSRGSAAGVSLALDADDRAIEPEPGRRRQPATAGRSQTTPASSTWRTGTRCAASPGCPPSSRTSARSSTGRCGWSGSS